MGWPVVCSATAVCGSSAAGRRQRCCRAAPPAPGSHGVPWHGAGLLARPQAWTSAFIRRWMERRHALGAASAREVPSLANSPPRMRLVPAVERVCRGRAMQRLAHALPEPLPPFKAANYLPPRFTSHLEAPDPPRASLLRRTTSESKHFGCRPAVLTPVSPGRAATAVAQRAE